MQKVVKDLSMGEKGIKVIKEIIGIMQKEDVRQEESVTIIEDKISR